MPEMTHGYGMPGPQERLASLRSPKSEAAQTRRTQRTIRIEVLVGAVIVVLGIAVALNVLVRGPEVVQQVQDPLSTQPIENTAESSRLLDGEALMAIAVEEGDYPPELRAGDSVKVVLTPGPDGEGGYREIDRAFMVRSVEAVSEVSGKTVVTVVGPAEIALGIASSGPIHLTIIDRGVAK